MNPNDPNYIPDASEVESQSFGSSYRAANGVLCRGKEGEDGYETVPKIVGRLLKVGVLDWENPNKKGMREKKLMCVIKTSTEELTLSAKFWSDKTKGEKFSSLTQFFGLARNLMAFEANDLIEVTASKSKDPIETEEGEKIYLTYVNLAKPYFDEAENKFKSKRIRLQYEKSEESKESLVGELLTALEKHPAWGEFEIDHAAADGDEEGSSSSGYALFEALCEKKKWPLLSANEAEWETVFKVIMADEFVPAQEIQLKHWNMLIAGLDKRKDAPQTLLDAIKAKAAAPPLDPADDPFAKI